MADPDQGGAAAPDWTTRKLSPAPSMIEVDDYHLVGHADQVKPGPYSYKLFGPRLSDDDQLKTPRQQLIDKLELDDDPEHMLLVHNVNDTIACNRELSQLYSRVDRDPYLFAVTFLSSGINAQLGLDLGLSNSLVFSVLNLIHNEAMMRRAIEPALQAELGAVRTPVDLLRNNSTTTRLLTLCAKALGQNLISLAVQPVVRQVVEQGGDVALFEIDPALQPNEAVRQANLKALCDAAADILKRVVAEVPPALISVCRITYAAIEAKFPTSGWIGISSVVFLRFICSSIVAGSPTSTPAQKRDLVLLAKLVQAAASLKKFDAKEAFMQATDRFLDGVIPQLAAFYSRFAAGDASADDVLSMAARSYLVVRKISSLTRIAEYLEALSANPTALALTNGSLTARIAYHLGFRRIIFSALHYCIFIYDDGKTPSATTRAVQPLERYAIETLDLPLATVNGVLILKVPDPVRLQFTDDEECLKWRHHIESYMEKCKSS